MASLQPHPNIVRVVDIDPAGPGAIIMPFEGPTLYHVIQNAQPMPPRGWPGLSRNLLTAIGHLHRHDVIHCDLKPGNLVVDPTNTLKLIDLGGSLIDRPGFRGEFSHGLDERGIPRVTLFYRAVELLLGDVSFGKPVDIWAAASIVAEFVVGAPLFMATTEHKVLKKIFSTLGAPTGDSLKYICFLPQWKAALLCDPTCHVGLQSVLGTSCKPAEVDWVRQLLSLHPAQRPCADSALASFPF